jgi:hypothetical protein
MKHMSLDDDANKKKNAYLLYFIKKRKTLETPGKNLTERSSQDKFEK